jgi:hypothetical protein
MATKNAIGSNKPIEVTFGGTGVGTLLDHGLLVGSGTAAVDSLAVGVAGQILIANTTADPSWSATPTVTTIYATNFDTNVVAAAVTLTGTTLSADGTDAAIDINITPKGTGKLVTTELSLVTDLAVTEGGTGTGTLTDHGVLIGSGTAAITPLAVGATGEILTGVTANDPTWLAAGDANKVLTAHGAGSAVTWETPGAGTTFASDAETIAGTVTNKAVAPSNLKAKLGTQTSHGLPYGAGDSSAIVWTAEPSNGQILIGKTGDVPALATITAGTNITVTNGAGTITISATDAVGVNDQTDSYELVIGDANKIVIMTKAGANNLTVPEEATTNFPVGTQVLVAQGGAGVTTIVAHAGVTIRSAGGLMNLFAQYSVCSLIKVGVDLWYATGDLG